MTNGFWTRGRQYLLTAKRTAGAGATNGHAGGVSPSADDILAVASLMFRRNEALERLTDTALAGATASAHSLRETANQAESVVTSGEELASSANELAASIEEMTSGAARLATSIAETSASAEETGRSIGAVATTATEMANIAATVATSLAEMTASVKSVSGDTDALAASVSEIASTVEENARSIEGVRGNADDLAAAAEETSRSIAAMATSTEQVAASAENMSGLAEQVATSVEETARSVEGVAKNAEVISRSVESAATNATELDRSMRTVASLTNEANDISRRTSRDAEEGGAAIQRSMEGLGRVRTSMVESAAVVKGNAQVAAGLGIIGFDRDRLSDQLDCNVVPPCLMRDDPQKMQCLGMIRLRGQNPPIELLRLREAPGLMVLEGSLKGLFDGDFSHGHCRESRVQRAWRFTGIPAEVSGELGHWPA